MKIITSQIIFTQVDRRYGVSLGHHERY